MTAQLHPAKPDPPLNLNAPKPKFTNAKQNSAYGFHFKTPSDTKDDSDVNMEQLGVENVADDSVYVDHDKGMYSFNYITRLI